MGNLRTRGWLPVPLQAMPRAIRPTKWRAPASVFSPRVRRARGLKRPNQPSSRLVETDTLGFPLAMHQVVPAGHEMPQELAHLPLRYRLPQGQQDRASRHQYQRERNSAGLYPTQARSGLNLT